MIRAYSDESGILPLEIWRSKMEAKLGAPIMLVLTVHTPDGTLDTALNESSDAVSTILEAEPDPETHRINPDITTSLVRVGFEAPVEFPLVDGRADLRSLDVIAIDNNVTHRFENSYSLSRLENGNYLWGIHVVDVTKLDLTSSAHRQLKNFPYFKVGKVKPTWSVLVEVGSDGRILKYDIFRSWVELKKAYTFDEVENILQDEKSGQHPNLYQLYAISKRSLDSRLKTGSVLGHTENNGNMIAAESAYLANRLVAEFLARKNLPALFRNQGTTIFETNRRKLSERLMAEFPNSDVQPKRHLTPFDLRRLIGQYYKKYERFPDELGAFASRLSLKSKGHFALNLPFYTMFTAPLRDISGAVAQRQLEAAIYDSPALSEKDVSKILSAQEESGEWIY
jgi:exoribonuclease R